MKLPILFILLTTSAHAVLIPADRLFNWTPGVNVGVQGGIIHRTSPIITVTGADPTGVTECSAVIQDFIDDAADNSVILIPAGTYKVGTAIILKSNITLRGAGRETTILRATGTGNSCVGVGGGSGFYYGMPQDNDATAGLTRGSDTLTVDDASVFSVGNEVQIVKWGSTNQNDSPLIVAVQYYPTVGGYAPQYRIMAKVTAKTSTTISIFPPLPADLTDPDTKVAVTPGTSVKFWGLEDMTVDGLHLTESTRGFFADSNTNGWIRNVRVKGYNNRDIWFQSCLFMEVRDCYLETNDAGFGSNGAGIQCNSTSFSLFENNIVIDVFPGIETNEGSAGNVFGYNFVWNASGAHGIDTNHNPHNVYNLYEGNITNSILADGYYGSVSQDTIFRNWATGHNTSFGIRLCRFTREYNVVGNISGGPTNDFDVGVYNNGINLEGDPQMGSNINNGNHAPPWPDWGTTAGNAGFQELDDNVETTTISKGNYNFYDDAIPAAESLGGDTLPDSLYRTSKPAWFGALTWPPINPFDSAGLAPYDDGAVPEKSISDIAPRIPAGYYYVNGVYPTESGSASGIEALNVQNLRVAP